MKDLQLNGITALRQLTFRVVFTTASDVFAFNVLPILTITSPVFRELVLELGRLLFYFYAMYWGYWGEIDKFLDERYAKNGNFRLIIRTGNLDAPSAFQTSAKEGFPLLASRGCIHFESSHMIDEL